MVFVYITDPDINQFAAKIVSSTIEMGKKKFLKEKKETGYVLNEINQVIFHNT